MNKIDFVITWVDGSDGLWLKEKERYSKTVINAEGASENRFRDWNLLRYWFRGVEKYASWVNKIFFVTWGHIPSWLDTNNPKIQIIKHEDYIPKEYLPTFNSNVIELFLSRIPELSEHFVLFNDDMFIISEVNSTDFFVNNLPKDEALLEAVVCQNTEDKFGHILLNNSSIINKHFNKNEVQKNQFSIFYTFKNRKNLIRNILLSPMEYFSGFRDLHLPSSHLKSDFDKLWQFEERAIIETAKHRFRDSKDINHWVLKNWRCCEGRVVPRDANWGKHLEIGIDKDIEDIIINQRYKTICINDSKLGIDFNTEQCKLDNAFNTIFPLKSIYEKD